MDSINPTGPPIAISATADVPSAKGKATAPPADPLARDAAAASGQDRRAAELQRLAEPVFAKLNQRLSIAFDDETDRFVYRTYDRTTGELVRQLPPESVFDLMGQLRDIAYAAIEDSGNSLDSRL